MENSVPQMNNFKMVAVDGKGERFQAEKCAAEWHAGAAGRARDRDNYGRERKGGEFRKIQKVQTVKGVQLVSVGRCFGWGMLLDMMR